MSVFIARGLALLWAVFWLVFFVVESLVWQTPGAVMAAWTALGVAFVMLALAAWRWERNGGLLLVAAGCVMGMAYTMMAPPGLTLMIRAITTAVFGGPPIVAGTLFLRHHRQGQERAGTGGA